MAGKITYHQHMQFCNKPNCQRCREGIGHGPYWYAYQTVNGRTKKTYIGKIPPPGIQGEDFLGDTPLVRLFTFGHMRLEYLANEQWQPVRQTAWVEAPMTQRLLGCLVSGPNRILSRDELLHLLWPGDNDTTATNALHALVQTLQKRFESLVQRQHRPLKPPPMLQEMGEIIALASQTHLWIDADVFKNLIVQARATTDSREREHLLEQAARLYTGDFLSDETQMDLVQSRREALRRSWVGLLLELADLRLACDHISGAIDTLELLLTADPANEAVIQRLMLALARTDRRSEAIQLYQRFVATLAQGSIPSQSIQALYEVVRRGEQLPPLWAWDDTGEQEKKQVSPTEKMVRIGRTHQSPLVGREKEITSLNRLLREAETPANTSRTHCVALMGDVGIGKTRLAEEVAHEAQQHNWTLVWGTVYAQESAVPYRIWIEALSRMISQNRDMRQEILRHPLRYQPLRLLLPELQDILPQESHEFPEHEQSRVWEATRALLCALYEKAPLLVVLDDLQWADRSSCELLAYLVRRMRNAPVLFLCTCRDSELPAHHYLRTLLMDLRREQIVEMLPLEPLRSEHIRELLTHLPEALVEQISTRACGNPFFAEELAREAISSDLLHLPETIQAVLSLRLEHLSPACQRLLERAAVLGDTFRFDTIRALASGGSSDDSEAILDVLEEALLAGMLTEEGEGLRATYHFWHPLLRAYLYEHLSTARRVSLHWYAAQVLQELFAGREAEGAIEITHHLINGAADRAHIARYAELAADHAYTLSAYPSAEKYYRLVLEYLGEMGLGGEQEERFRQIYLLERLGECTMSEGKYEEARQFYERSLAFHTAQPTDVSLEQQQYEAQWQALLWCEISRTWRYLGENVKARESLHYGEQVLQYANVGTGPAWAKIRYQQGDICWLEGRLTEALTMGEEALQRFEALPELPQPARVFFPLTQSQRILHGDPLGVGRVYSLLAGIKATLGQSADALHNLRQALEIFEHNDIKREVANVCCNLGDLYLRTAEYEQAHLVLSRSQALAEEIGDASILSIALGNLGVLATRLGNIAEAEGWYRKAVELIAQTNELFYASLFRSYLAIALIEQGKLDEAEDSLTQALKISHILHIAPCAGFALIALGHFRFARALASRIPQRSVASVHKQRPTKPFEHLLQRAQVTLQHALTFHGLEADTLLHGQLLLARIALLLGEIEYARDLAAKALEKAQASELVWLQASAQSLLGQFYMLAGQQTQADEHFHRALATFTQTGMRLEYARTLYSYGTTLSQTKRDFAAQQQIAQYFREAHRLFQDCQADIDRQSVEQFLPPNVLHASSPKRKRRSQNR